MMRKGSTATHLSRRFALAVPFALLLACSDSSPTGPTPPPAGDTTFVAQGQIEVPSGSLHSPFLARASASANLGPAAGRILRVTLADAVGSVGECDARCPSIDWSDANGTFANRVTVNTPNGPLTLYLTQNRGLSDTPDAPDPI